MVGDIPLDKDGVSAAAVISEMAHSLYYNGTTIYRTLQSIYDTYGHFVTNNKYVSLRKKEKKRKFRSQKEGK